MSSLIGTTLATRTMQNLETLHYYVLCTLFPIPGALDNQCTVFPESQMAYLDFAEFPDLIKYYTTIGNCTILKEEYITIENCTLLKDLENLMNLTQLNLSADTPNQVLHMMSTLILWLKTFFTTSGQYSTL